MPLTLKGKPRLRKPSDDPEDFRATLVEHLEELRDRIVRMLVFLSVGWVAGWYLEAPVYGRLNGIVTAAISRRMPAGTSFQTTFFQATEPFLLKFKLSFMIGIILSFPFIVLQLWGFISPGLKKAERKAIRSVAPVSVILFMMGVSFCWVILPSAFTWFTSYVEEFPGTSLIQEAGTMVFLVLKMILAFGIGFQLPLVVFVLGKLGLLSPDTLLRNWRQATAAIFFIAMVITPSNDLFSMLMMAVPLSILFIASVYAVKFTARNAAKNEPELNDLD